MSLAESILQTIFHQSYQSHSQSIPIQLFDDLINSFVLLHSYFHLQEDP